MFSTQMAEPIKHQVVEIEDFDEETVRGMLEYVYTGESKTLEENSMNLLKINAHYQVVAFVQVKLWIWTCKNFIFTKQLPTIISKLMMTNI